MALRGVLADGSLTTTSAAGVLLIVDDADANYQKQVDALLGRLNNPVPPSLYPNHLMIQNSGAPSNGTNAVKTLTIGGTPSGGTFQLAFGNYVTKDIEWSSTNATLLANILAALNALAAVRSGDIAVAAGTLSSGVGTITLTFGGYLAALVVDDISVVSNDLTGTSPTVAMAQTTAGVTATGRGASAGTVLQDTTNGVIYVNRGTAYAPDWTPLGVAAPRQFLTTISDLSAGADLSATTIWIAPTVGATLTGAYIVPLGSSAGVDDSNTAVLALTDGDGNSIVSKTYNTATQPPSANTVGSLGTLDATHKVLTASEVVKFALTQGTSANLPSLLLVLEYTVADVS